MSDISVRVVAAFGIVMLSFQVRHVLRGEIKKATVIAVFNATAMTYVTLRLLDII